MTFSLGVGFLALLLLGLILAFVWRLVRSPLPLQMQQELEKREEARLGVLKEEWSGRLSQEVERIWKQVQGQVQTTETLVSQRVEEATRTLSQVEQQLGKVWEATRQVEAVGRNVATLQELLRAPKIRGGLGEFFLADLLSQILPADCYCLQYEFSDGQRVDAAIRLKDRLVPIDSKFPLEQFRKMGQAVTDEERAEWRKLLVRDVKQHIDSVAQKYIRPSEGTFDFALMYLPAESVYYETVIKEDVPADEKGVFQHAISRQVIPVSPNSFYAYLQVILQGLRGLAVEARSKEILEHLMKLQSELESVRKHFNLAGSQLKDVVRNFDKAERSLNRFEDRLGVIEAPLEKEALRDDR